MSDVEAIEAVKRGEKDRYAELVARYETMVYGVVWSRLGDPFLCQDAAQETFIKAYRYLAGLRNPEKFAAWLARIARNVSISMLRTRRRELDARRRWELEPAAGMSDRYDTSDVSERPAFDRGESLRASLQELSPNDRESLVLFYLEGKSIHDSASLLNISDGAMKTRLYRARQALRGRLEDRLEDSLTALRPPRDFSSGVMALLPALPLGAGFGVPAGLVKQASWGSGISISPLLIMLGFPLAFNVGMFGWFAKLERDNLRPSRAQTLRKRMAVNNAVAFIMVTVIALGTAVLVSSRSPILLFQLLSVYCLWGCYRTLTTYRINPSRFVFGTNLASFAMLVICVLIGFLHAPFWIFFAIMLPMNIVLYQTNKGEPLRHDYNLFLRYTLGLMTRPDEVGVGGSQFTRTELISFARFLGVRFLAHDYRVDDSGIVIYLAPVRTTILQQFGILEANSIVQITHAGAVSAVLGKRDRAELQRLTTFRSTMVEEATISVERVVEAALQRFLNGDHEQAERLLQTEADKDVFKQSTGSSARHKIRGALAIAAAIFLLVSSLSFLHLKPKSVSERQANHALDQWCAEEHLGEEFRAFLVFAPIQPPSRFFENETRRHYHDAVMRHFLDGPGKDANERVIEALFIARPLFHALEHGILNPRELEELGFTAESVRRALNAGGKERLKTWAEYPNRRLVDEAYRLAILAKFDCLDFVDQEALIADVAAAQVLDNFQPPQMPLPIDLQRARGLFVFTFGNLEETRSALWILETLGRLDAIDREACIDGIMRFYQGDGIFRNSLLWRKAHVPIYGTQDDTFHAMESLHILGALGRVDDLKQWHFSPVAFNDDVTVESLLSFAYQYRLEQLLQEP